MNKFAVAAVGLTVTLGIGLVLLFVFWGDDTPGEAADTTIHTSSSTTSPGPATTSSLPATTTTMETTTTSDDTTTTTLTSTTSPPTPSTTIPVTTIPRPPFSITVSTPTAAQLFASWEPGCPVDVGDLRILTMSHWGYDGKVRNGKLVVAAVQVGAVTKVFQILYDAQFPIERMELIEEYGGDDNASMAANNTSAFNCRLVTGGTSYSEHSYGHAIDINPLVNPYVKGSTILPPAGAPYADRSKDATGMIHAGDEVVMAFNGIGWVWGGTWTSLKDYQHFSATGK